MAKFATFKDMFKWNKQLFEDDFNEGKLYTVKHKKDLGNKTVSLELSNLTFHFHLGNRNQHQS